MYDNLISSPFAIFGVQLEDSVASEVLNALDCESIRIDWDARPDLDEIV